MLKTVSIPAPKMKNTSAPSSDHIVVAPTTLVKRTSYVDVRSTAPSISNSTSLLPRGDQVARDRSTTQRGTTISVVLSTIPPAMVSAVLGNAQSPRFYPFQINSSCRALLWAIFRWPDAHNPSPLSLLDLNHRMPKHGATSSPAHYVVEGTSPSNQYKNSKEDCIDLFITCMADDHLVDIAEMLKKPSVLRDFTKNPNVL